jgi:hypothetical protein
LIKACARATGADKTAPTATAMATQFELVSIILPPDCAEPERRGPRGQPISSIKPEVAIN